MQDPNTDHARHDSNLIAGHAAGDLVDSERTIAEALLATCTPCADLHRDLLAIATATRTLPAPTTANRDFRIASEQAERLRRGSWLRAALRPFASTHTAVRPMAAAFTSLGIVGLLVATVIPGLLGSAASPNAERDALTGTAASSAPVAAPVVGQGGGPGAAGAPGMPGTSGAVPTQDNEFNAYNPSSPGPDAASPGAKDARASSGTAGAGGVGIVEGGSGTEQSTITPAARAAPANLLLVGSLGLLAAGLVLFGLGFAGRRLR